MRSQNPRVQQLTLVAWFRGWLGRWRFWFVVAVMIAAAVMVPEDWKLFAALGSFFLLSSWSKAGLTFTR